MAYTINLTNGAIFAEIPDGQTNETSQALVLVGKNYTGYGEFIGENFIHLLENSADESFVGAPLTGQLWFNSLTKSLSVYDGLTWKGLGTNTPAATEPLPAESEIGDVWFNTTTEQTYIYNGATYILINQNAPADAGVSGPVASTNDGHELVEYWVNDELVAIMSKDATFTPNPAITGFATISPGFQLSTTVQSGNAVFTGTASNALTLDGNGPNDFLSAADPDTTAGTLGIINDGGLTFGLASDGRLKVITGDLVLQNVTQDGSTIFEINRGGTPVEVATVDGTTARLTVVNDPLLARDVVNLAYMNTAIGSSGMTDSEVKIAYENNANTNEYDDAEQTKLAGIETAATADQTASEIKVLTDSYNHAGANVVTANFLSTQTIYSTASANLFLLAASNKAAGRKFEWIIENTSGSPIDITLNGSWRSFGEASPITVPAAATLVLSLSAIGAAETDVLCAAVLEN